MQIGNAYMRLRGKDLVVVLAPTFSPYHVQGFNPRSLQTMLINTGFVIREFKMFGETSPQKGIQSLRKQIGYQIGRLINGIDKIRGKGMYMDIWAQKITNKMRVLALVPNQKGYAPGQRGSIELWEKVLEPAGIAIEFAPFETDKLRRILHQAGQQTTKALEMMRSYANRIKLLQTVDDYDAVFVYREAAMLGPAFLERLIARKRPIIYQLDDPLFIPYRSPSNGVLSYLKFFGKIKEIIRLSKVVIVNSSHIYDYARQYNDNVRRIPSIVDTEKFMFEPFPPDLARPCIGWSGSPTTLKNITLLEAPLYEISKRDICDLHFIGGTDFGLQDVSYTSQKWNGSTEVKDLRRMQVGLVPLPSDPWNKYKFIMKTAQYMALGIVPVGTPMASNPEVIRHGENGFLAANDTEWLEYLTLLASDGKLRNEMSESAARDAAEHYSLGANTSKIIEAFRAAVQ